MNRLRRYEKTRNEIKLYRILFFGNVLAIWLLGLIGSAVVFKQNFALIYLLASLVTLFYFQGGFLCESCR